MSHAAQPMWRSLTWPIAVFGIAALASILQHGPMPLFSTRTLTVAWEMWSQGSWLVPLQNGEAYSHKAPLLYWLIHAGWLIGGVGEAWPKLLAVLLGGINLALVGVLGRNLFPAQRAVPALAAWVLGGTLFYFLYALQIMFDVLVSVAALISLIGLTRRDSRGAFAPSAAWVIVGLAMGLLAKGPVALLHIAFPLLLAPLWLDAARVAPARWYRRIGLWVAAALALFALWVVPVAIIGGEAYRHELLVTQTAGRVVSAFDHARPFWWYLTILPVLLFPWFFWAGGWRAVLVRAPSRASEGMRFLGVWLIGTLLAFSLVSGKQAYYVLPQLGGFALLLAAAVCRGDAAGSPRAWLWTAGLAWITIGALFASLPTLIARGTSDSPVVVALASAGPWFGIAVVAIGAALLAPAASASAALKRLGAASIAAAFLLHLQFTLGAWPRYDLAPASDLIAREAASGTTIANRGVYEGQFHFLARLTRPIVEIDYTSGADFARREPEALVIDYVDGVPARAADLPAPLLTQPFRSDTLEVWRARDWLAAGQASGPPPRAAAQADTRPP